MERVYDRLPLNTFNCTDHSCSLLSSLQHWLFTWITFYPWLNFLPIDYAVLDLERREIESTDFYYVPLSISRWRGSAL